MKTIYVGKGLKYSKINDAIASVNEPTIIYLQDNFYHEKVVVDKPNIIIDGQNIATIEYNDYASKIHQDGREYVTFRTYTMLVKAENVTLLNLTIINDAGEGDVVSQAVALHLYNDNITCINCKIMAKQDTLFCGPFSKDLIQRYVDLLSVDERVYTKQFHQKFINCFISGTVDFIFGGACCDFINCKIVSDYSNKDTWICAPDHEKENTYGFNFINCEIIKGANTKDDSVYLARPWREYGLVRFINCYLDTHIKKEGFSIWEGTNRHLNARFYEINSTGPGSNDEKRISWANIIRRNKNV